MPDPEFVSTEPNWDELGIDPNEEVGVSEDAYIPSSEFPPPPPIGNYLFKGIDGGIQWGRDKNKQLYLRGNFEVADGPLVRRRADAFISLMIPPFRSASVMDDFLRAAGETPNNGSRFTNVEVTEKVQASWSKLRKGKLDWEGYCPECRQTVARGINGAKKENAKGFKAVGFGKKHIIQCPICGEPVQARGRIVQWYSI